MTTFKQAAWRQAAGQAPAIIVVAVFLALSINGWRTDSLYLIGDWSTEARITAASGDRMDISLAEAESLFRSQAAVFIDARSKEAYAQSHIRDARSIPWHQVDRFFMKTTADLSVDKPIVTYCDGETCNLSHDLALFLRDAGFSNVRVLVNGWTLWQAAGLPTEGAGKES